MRSSVLVGILVLSLNLRAALAAYPPLLGEVREGLGIAAGTAGAVQTVAILTMAAGSLVGPRAGRWFGAVRGLGGSVAVVGLGCLVRGIPSVVALFVGTLLIGLGIGVSGVLLTAVVKDRLADRAGVVSGLYVVAMMLGTTVAGAAAVPLSVALGGWSWSLAAWAVPAVLAVVIWSALVRGSGPRTGEPHARLPWRDPFARRVAAFQSGVSLTVYGSLTWIAPAYVDRGWSPATAGLMVAVWSLAQMPAALVGPGLAERTGRFRPWGIGLAACTVVGVLGIVLVPEPPVVGPWLWIVLIGIACGAGFPLGLAVIAWRTPDARASAATSGMALGVGYTVAGIGPLLMGVLVDLTGGYAAAMLVLLVAAGLQAGAAVRIGNGKPRADAPVSG